MINLVKRNLEQQVLKNQDDIEALKQLGMPGVKVTAVADDIEDITEPIEGAFYLIKNGSTYDLYVYTADEEFFDLGEFPKPGPQGLTGNPGPQGIQGVSTRWYSGIRFPTVNIKDGDMFLNTSSYEVYIRSGNLWIPQTNIKGAAGRDGLNGQSITNVAQIPIQGGTKVIIETSLSNTPITFDVMNGEKGDPGAGFHIADTITYLTPLPADIIDTLTEDYPPEERDYSEAILVKCLYTNSDNQPVQKSYVFVIVDGQNGKEWDSAGQIEGIQGEQGPAGLNGNMIIDSADIFTASIPEQPNNNVNLFIKNIPYLTTAPATDNLSPLNRPGFKVVMLPKSVEASTVRKEGYVYLFYEDPQTP